MLPIEFGKKDIGGSFEVFNGFTEDATGEENNAFMATFVDVSCKFFDPGSFFDIDEAAQIASFEEKASELAAEIKDVGKELEDSGSGTEAYI